MAPRLLAVPVRARAMVARGVLDVELASGIDPCRDAALAWRAVQLCNGRSRRLIAKRLRQMAATAAAPGGGWRLTPLARSQVVEERDALLALAIRLESPQPVMPMGVAMAKLVADGTDGPFFVGTRPGALHTVLRVARIALDVTPRAAVTARFLEDAS